VFLAIDFHAGALGLDLQAADGSGGGGASRGSSLSDPQVNSAPVSLLVGRTQLVADNITNSLIIQGPPAAIEIIEKLLDQVDVKADQVMISTVFGQLSLKDRLETGIDWLRAFRGNNSGGIAGSSINDGGVNSFLPTDMIFPRTGTASSTNGTNTNSATIGFPNQSGLSLYGQIGNSLTAYVKALSTNNDFTVLSRPSIFTANNQKGTISSGRRIAVPTNSFNSGANGQSTNIEYRDVVLKLEVIPLVNSEKEITLQIALVSDDVLGNTSIEGIGNVPVIGTRELVTTVTVPNNQTIILGGLITTNETDDVAGIPLLSNIPGLGRLFSTNETKNERDELMIFIQPSIVNNEKSLQENQLNMDARYDVSEQAREFSESKAVPSLGENDTQKIVPTEAKPRTLFQRFGWEKMKP
jgi:general secretion pathway protein D